MLRHHHKALAFIVAIFGVLGASASLAAHPLQTSAQQQSSACTNYYTSTIPVPAGYGAAYDINAPSTLLVKAVCDSATPHLQVGDGNTSRYIYNQGYWYGNGQWNAWTFSSSNALVSNAWYTGSAYVNFGPGTDYSSWEYDVAYICTWNGQAWQCGCHDTACSTSYWQLQAFMQPSAGGGSSSATWSTTVDPNAIVIAPNGNDGNPCTQSAPCQSLGKAQQKAQGASDKTIYLRAGNYSGGLNLGGSDSGETWQSYPTDGVDSAVIDGGGAGSGANVFYANGAQNLTINGITVKNFGAFGILVYGGSGSVVENNIVTNGGISGAGVGSAAGISIGDHATAKNNVVMNTYGGGMTAFAYDAGSTLDGAVIENNVVLGSCQQLSDCGAVYTNMKGTAGSGGHPIIRNNFIRDYGSASLTNDVVGIYLDDQTSNTTVIGNVIGPPCSGCINNGNRNLTGGILINSDNVGDPGVGHNILTGNIIDVGNSSMVHVGELWGSGNDFEHNVVVFGFTGGLNTSSGNAYQDGAPGTPPTTIANNAYTNCAGGQVFYNGTTQNGDTAPVTLSPSQLGLSGYTYNLSGSSAALGGSVSFPGIQGGWGPPGYTIPNSSNHSCP